MKTLETDILIVGAGPVGLMCGYLAQQNGLSTLLIDKSEGPLQVGRADALNARTLQLMELAGLFDELYPLGKPCNTSSVWSNGEFQSRQSKWWDELEGCQHKHFLMLGQSYVEQLLDRKMQELNAGVKRQTLIDDLQIIEDGCVAKLSTGESVKSKYVIGADGSRSFVRNRFDIPFEIERPQIVWAVIDAVIETDFPKVPEIIVFQAETSDVAWIPREGKIDRFYVRMDTKDFQIEDAVAKINHAMQPHTLSIKELEWFSLFSVKESVAERYSVDDKVFLAGDSCHIHSVNGGQGLNTGLADAFNLMWKLSRVVKGQSSKDLLKTYEAERKPVALSVVATSGELVRTTKYSETGTHAQDYVKLVEKRAGNITGMGIRYSDEGLSGQRFFDFDYKDSRIYSRLDYSKYNLVVFGELPSDLKVSIDINLIKVEPKDSKQDYYSNQAILVRPDSYIATSVSLDSDQNSLKEFLSHV